MLITFLIELFGFNLSLDKTAPVQDNVLR